MAIKDNLELKCQFCNQKYETLFLLDQIFEFHRSVSLESRCKFICKNCVTKLLEEGLVPKRIPPEERKLLGSKFGMSTCCVKCGGKGYDIGRDQFGIYREFDCPTCKGIGSIKLGDRYGTKEALICVIIGSAIIYNFVQMNSNLGIIIGIIILLFGLIIYWVKDTIPPFG